MDVVVDELLAWAHEEDVELNGVKPRRFPGRGLGIVATRHIEVWHSCLPSSKPGTNLTSCSTER